MDNPAPAYMTKKIRSKISQRGTRGVSYTTLRRWVRAGRAGQKAKDEPMPEPCPGAMPSPDAVQAGTCETWPAGCTANFIYYNGNGDFGDGTSDGRHYFIGTAGHCVDHANQPVYMQVGAAVVHVGWVEKKLEGGIGQGGQGEGGIGNDFSVVRVRQGLRAEPQMPGGGPDGIYTGCESQIVKYFGHGYEFVVGQGKFGGGLATNWNDRGYGWSGTAFGGDSGSGVQAQDNLAAGDLTHFGLDDKYPGSTSFGTRLTRALTWLGANWYLVKEDRTLERKDMSDTQCGGASSGGAGGGTLPIG